MSTPGRPHLISNPSESYQVNIIVCAALTWVVGAVFVALRFYTRGYLLQNVLGTEDWFILVALVFSGATSAGMIEPIYGLGKHALDVDMKIMQPLARAGWYTILWYMMALLFTKISILMLYIRILSYQHARYAVYAIMAIVIFANGLWTFVTVITACVPLQAFWDHTLPNAYCHSSTYWFANTGLHIGTDILLYVLPLPVIINLQIKTRQKIFLYSIFALGFLVCAISVVRLWDLVEEYKRVDFTFDNVSISYLTCIEVNAAIACACCMTLKPLVMRVFPRLWGSRSDSARRDVEAAAAAAAAAVAGGRRGPPTIGSKPSRLTQQQQQHQHHSWFGAAHHTKSDSNLQLLDEEEGSAVSSKLSISKDVEAELPTVMMVEDSNNGTPTVTEPPAAYAVEKST
ncbi:hypothetical protein B0H66DRAFT_580695 [Apodospora peruviana]|uniref:Rhodopsin domain-containing protein n=1 Tax=Apodospora peruviana TaxID=516989 RepID=A0AAE0IJ48_9PEZI|nr:hypothetical protein B0H66DRAFT_580695 [Apodospora peruviana]